MQGVGFVRLRRERHELGVGDARPAQWYLATRASRHHHCRLCPGLRPPQDAVLATLAQQRRHPDLPPRRRSIAERRRDHECPSRAQLGEGCGHGRHGLEQADKPPHSLVRHGVAIAWIRLQHHVVDELGRANGLEARKRVEGDAIGLLRALHCALPIAEDLFRLQQPRSNHSRRSAEDL